MVRLYFLRHGNTKGDFKQIFRDRNWQADLKRDLTPKGQQQAQMRRQQLGNPAFDLCIVSPAERCRQTAQTLLGNSDVRLIELPTLYPAPEGTAGVAIWNAFKKLMYLPLSCYLESEAGLFISENGQTNAGAIRKIIAEHPSAQNILIVDHAVTLQAAGQNFTPDKHIFAYRVGEVEGFTIDMATKRATIIKDPKPLS